MVKVELHAHTSDDPVDSIPYTSCELIDRAAALGYGALAITLHEKQLDVRRLESYAAALGVVLIPGIERSVEGRHVLLLNFPGGTEDVHTFDDLRRLKAQTPGGLVVAPHPFFPGGQSLFGRLTEHADLFDAVEYNAMYTAELNFNGRAEAWARRQGKPMVGNCDVHRLRQLGSTYSLVDAEPNASSICAAIAAGRVRVVTQPVSWATAVTVVGALVASDIFRRGTRALQPAPASI
jgi:predicted metal-dependent phosphoesterase TrpH